ncbi:hypothetical protein RvY_07429 [Ramazzottius varieornatus]|uniref:Cx9C motif-containing protein 4 n=1 Tax=Ramazzottius varieornatus TaxID=947166 RepID=A0A1D1V244_RAMVA|nr:hypothetical protein RvY_07429 [Ramazzottius varieornatus]
MTDPCQAHACAIQTCLKQNNWQDSKCGKELQNLLDCCKKFQEGSPMCVGMRSQWEEKAAKKPST